MATDKNKSLIMARRLKDLRNEIGLSYELLRKALMEKYEINISIDSLKNYEVYKVPHAKVYKNEGMRVEYLRCLADFYGVSTDYLLGISDVRSLDVTTKRIVEETGLSENATEVLQSLNKRSQGSVVVSNVIATINLLLENADERKPECEVIPLLECISAYLHCTPDDERIVAVEDNGDVHIYPDRASFQKEQSPVISGDYMRQIVKVSLEQRVMNELRDMWNEKNGESRKKYIERMLKDIQKAHK